LNTTSKALSGVRSKMVLTEIGPVQIDVPRDTVASFIPQIVKKRQRHLTGVEIVLSLTALGLTTGEISAHFAEVYGASASKDTVSKITDKVVEQRTGWCNRSLDPGVSASRHADCVEGRELGRSRLRRRRPFVPAVRTTTERGVVSRISVMRCCDGRSRRIVATPRSSTPRRTAPDDRVPIGPAAARRPTLRAWRPADSGGDVPAAGEVVDIDAPGLVDLQERQEGAVEAGTLQKGELVGALREWVPRQATQAALAELMTSIATRTGVDW
jgi:hypothetical protein